MHIVFSSGGTGGHILPAIAVIRALRARGADQGSRVHKAAPPSASSSSLSSAAADASSSAASASAAPQISWIGGKNSLEQEFAKRENIPFYPIQVGKWRRYFDIKNFFDLVRAPVGFFQSLRLLSRLNPDVVFAKGGYVSAPVGLAAKILGIPLVIHESDATPGLATRLLAPFASRIFLGFEPAAYFFTKYASKTEVIGTPVREEIFHGQPSEARLFLKKIFGRAPVENLPTVLAMGGSLGAASLNTLIWDSLPELTKFCQVIHLTGKGKSQLSQDLQPQKPTDHIKPQTSSRKTHTAVHESASENHYFPVEYADAELPHLYALSDLVVTRAGASALSELIALRKPHILIPLGTHASRGDQWANAKYFAEVFGSPVLSESTLTSGEFLRTVKRALMPEELKKIYEAISVSASSQFKESALKIAAFLASLSRLAAKSSASS